MINSGIKCFVLSAVSWLASNLAAADIQIADGPFQATPESLRQYKCPDWFRDAKFGIFICWNAYAVPGAGGWYARDMYIEGDEQYKYHLKHFGHPSKVGYKDIIQMWKGEKFDPDKLAALFKQAGAKYIVPMANHHDNFDLWDSKYHEWNSVNYGPKKDIVGLWRDATLKQGLRFGVTEHNARSYSWVQTNKGADKSGPLKGVPYDGNDPKYKGLYHEKSSDSSAGTPANPPERWRKEWALRTMDLIDRYQPDLMYYDGAIPFAGEDNGKTGMQVIAHFYNQNVRRHNGRQEGVMFIKNIPDHGVYVDGVATVDHEGKGADRPFAEPWQTDQSIGDWFWSRGVGYRSATDIIHALVDVVSKNGNLLLNVPPRADGSLDDQEEKLLIEIGKWMDVNGEAIYGTRPWTAFGEGNIRFTTKGDVLYAIVLGWPGDGATVTIKALAEGRGSAKVDALELLGHAGQLQAHRDAEGLHIRLPGKKPTDHAIVLKIATAAETVRGE